MDIQTDRQTDMTKIIVAFHHFANTLRKETWPGRLLAEILKSLFYVNR
jgi:hypothetical protein